VFIRGSTAPLGLNGLLQRRNGGFGRIQGISGLRHKKTSLFEFFGEHILERVVGGDQTVDLLDGLLRTDLPPEHLMTVVPCGDANAVAHRLKDHLSLDPARRRVFLCLLASR
jgi:hypothetical protein